MKLSDLRGVPMTLRHEAATGPAERAKVLRRLARHWWPADSVARSALLSGESVGVDKLGPSIAMLPTADAATIAFAEVASFEPDLARANELDLSR